MQAAPLITRPELEAELESAAPPVLVDCRLADDYQQAHLPGAVNNCVFEVSFLNRMQALADLDERVVVYGADADSHEARVAADKLTRAGYTNVAELREGLASWQGERSGEGLRSGGPNGVWTVEAAASTVRWVGRNLLKNHRGSIGIREGQLQLHDGLPVHGRIVIDPTQLVCDDLAGSDLHEVLIDHLLSDDFLDAARHPDVTVEIQSAARLKPDTPGARNVRIKATVSLRGHTRMIEFPAITGQEDDGRWVMQATLSIDRTEWGMVYGSGRYFRRLGPHVVNDEIDCDLELVAIP